MKMIVDSYRLACLLSPNWPCGLRGSLGCTLYRLWCPGMGTMILYTWSGIEAWVGQKKMVYKVYNFTCMDLWNACGCWASSLANLQWTTLWHDPFPAVRSIVQAVESSPETLLWRWNVARRTLLWGCSKAMRSPQSSCDDYDVSMRSQTSRILIDDVSICISQCQFCKLFPSKSPFLCACLLQCWSSIPAVSTI
jgi:hypothetical protein